MEKKQLDFDQPLLSVRRISPTLSSSRVVNKKKIEKSFPLPHRQHSIPLPKSDYELGEVTKPAAVPFVWEHIPGRPKSGKEPEAQSPDEPSSTPRLPPRRAFDVQKQHVNELYKDRNMFKPRIEVSPSNDVEPLWDKLKKRVNEEWGSNLESEGDGYSDALDMLSPTESLSMNCSVSNLSGYGELGGKLHGTFSVDTQTRDFMMSRFLPAAKAMVLTTPQYVSKKQPMTPEQPRVAKPVVREERRPVHEQERSAIVPHYGKYTEKRESDDEGDAHEDSGKKSVRVFGLFSRFCLKNSMCLLNPVPGMKAKTLVQTSAKKVKRPARTAYSGPLSRTVDKNSWGAVPKLKLDSRSHSHELHKVKSIPSIEPNRLSYSGDLQMMRESSPYRSFTRCAVSPYQNESSRSPFREGMGFLGVKSDIQNVKPIKGYQSMIPTVEKTLHIDSVNTVEPPVSESISALEESLKEPLIKDTAPAESIEGLKFDLGRDQPGSTDCSKLTPNGVTNANKERVLKADEEGNNPAVSSMLSPLPPPLPKSPSESWLWRTLPSIPLRHQKKQRAKDSSTGTKWETIVKSSNVRHDHVRYSEELVSHISPHSISQK